MRAHRSTGFESGDARASAAFTLIELLVVIAIIAAISVISLPSLRGLGQSNVVVSGTQQLVDDLMLARHKAIVNRTVVHVLFVPPSIKDQVAPTTLSTRDRALWERLRAGAYTMYAIYAERSLGDQPGQRAGRYLTEWRSLPDGVFIGTYEYDDPPGNFNARPALDRPFGTNYQRFPFPRENSTARVNLPMISFDENGRFFQYELSSRVRRYRDEYIELAKGSVLWSRNGGTVEIDAREIPPNNANSTNNYNRIRIDPMSGRARLERPEIEFGN
jgi:prepilin-type N-terminal cleavage/methylation domain-containing protein